MTTTTPIKLLEVQLDVCFDDYPSEWAAVGQLISDAKIESQVDSVKQAGTTPNGWPSMLIYVKSEDAARSLIAEYLQLDRYDEEVDEYLQYVK